MRFSSVAGITLVPSVLSRASADSKADTAAGTTVILSFGDVPFAACPGNRLFQGHTNASYLVTLGASGVVLFSLPGDDQFKYAHQVRLYRGLEEFGCSSKLTYSAALRVMGQPCLANITS